jgi:hypothetical protein
MKWKHFDNWIVKVVAFILIIGSIWWMAYSVRWHYHTKQASWEYLPFAVSLIAIIFSMAMLSLKATQGAAAVVLPFAQLVIERLGGKKDAVSMTVTPPAPGQAPAGTVEVKPDPDRDAVKP